MKAEVNYTPQKDIADLMKLYDQEILPFPQVPDRETLLLRARLLFEEAMEFVEAAGCTVLYDGADIDVDCLKVVGGGNKPDLIEMADAIGDTLVVTYGAANALGIQVQPVWDEIQRSNLSKQWTVCSVCSQPLIDDRIWGWCHEVGELGTCPEWEPVLKIRKREDGKVIKAPSYSPANIQAVLDQQTAATEGIFGFGILNADKCAEVARDIRIGSCCTTIDHGK